MDTTWVKTNVDPHHQPQIVNASPQSRTSYEFIILSHFAIIVHQTSFFITGACEGIQSSLCVGWCLVPSRVGAVGFH